MCSIPAIWCWLLWDAAKSSAARSTPIFAYIGSLATHAAAVAVAELRRHLHVVMWGACDASSRSAGLPVLQAVQQGEREQFLEALVTLGKSERNILVANNAYLAEEASGSLHNNGAR